ncbi:retrovirus-related pol polyprotein from transposon TNT 1-94 [Tanacetum coccineum]
MVGPKVGFKPAKEYRPVAKKPTANTSSIKKKGVEPAKEVSNSYPFDVLNSVVNVKELGTNGGGASNFPSKGATSSRSSVEYPGDHDNDDEVYSVDNDMAHDMATEMVGFGTQSSELALASYSNSDDIQAAGSDTCPPMLDRTDYDSWSQRIRLDTLGTTPEGGVLLGPERPRTYDDLNDNGKKRFDGDVRATNILTKENKESQLYDEFERFKMLPGENINEYYVRFHKLVNDMRNIKMTMPNIQLNSKFVNNMSPEWDRNFAWGNGAAGNGGAHNRAGNANAGQGKPIKCYNCNGLGHIARNCTQPKHPQNYDYLKDKMLLMQAQENVAVLDEEELLFLAGEQTNAFDADVDNQPVKDLSLNEDNIFQANKCDAFDSDVHDLDNAIDPSDNNQVKHEIHNEVQQITVIDSTSADMGNSNVIPYEQYLTVNNVSVVPSSASSVPNVAYVLHDNDAYVPTDPLATELIIYKEQVVIYQQRAKFELTLRERKMDEQMSILIRDRNKKEENLKKELHSVKLQLNSTIQNNKIFEETVTALKQEFKQKETKFLIDFSYLKNLKDKLENKLYSHNQSIQTVHMMLKPTKLYDQDAESAIGVQNPFYLRKAKKAQPALYDGDELLKTHHVPVIVTSSEEDLELAETTRIKMNEKMNDYACVEKRVKIIPPNYSKENFMATFTPHTQLTPEQDFEKTCKKRITPTGITEGERGFEQTKRCYLTEVIPFFNLLKEHFDEVQKSLVKEVRAMKVVFENLEDEVDQNAIALKSDEIERKNLLITNETLIANCIAQDVFYIVTDSVMNAYRFHELSTSYNVAMNRAVDLEAENSKLLENIQNDNHNTMVRVFSKLEIAHLNLQLKYKHLKENLKNFKSKSSKDVPEFDAFFKLGKRDDQIQGISTATTARRLQPKRNTTNDKTLPANSVPKTKVEDHPRNNKSKLSKKNRVGSSISVRCTIFNTNSNSLCKTCNECIISFNHDKCVEHFLKSSKTSPVKKIWRVKQVKQIWTPTGKVLTTVDYHWKPTGRIFPLGEQCPLTRNTKPKVMHVKQWKPTGRLFPFGEQCPLTRNTTLKVMPIKQWKPIGRPITLGGHCPLVRPTALNSSTMLADPHANKTLVAYNLVCTNQQDPNCN